MILCGWIMGGGRTYFHGEDPCPRVRIIMQVLLPRVEVRLRLIEGLVNGAPASFSRARGARERVKVLRRQCPSPVAAGL